MTNCNDNFKLIQSYPLFKSNQVLTCEQLNGFVSFLEQQERLTRIYTTGTGIICGLKVNWAGEGLHLTAGFGVTSEGYLIFSQECTFKAYRIVQISNQFHGISEEDPLLKFIYELQTERDNDNNQVLDLKAEQLKDRVLVLLLECVKDANDDLCHDDCDERGKNINFVLHNLLIPIELADKILTNGYDPENKFVGKIFADLQEMFYFKHFIPYPYVERFGYQNVQKASNPVSNAYEVHLDTINNYNLFQQLYKTILVAMVERIKGALETVHKVFSPVFTPGEVQSSSILFNQIYEYITSEKYHRFEVQYLCDYLCDLVNAYQEFIENAFDLVADCQGNGCRFPKHLFVCKFDTNSNPDLFATSVYRTPYTQPPVYNSNSSRLEETRMLFERLRQMAAGYKTPDFMGTLETHITPDRSDAYPLSQRAVPFYYKPSLVSQWNPRRRRMGRTDSVYSYHRSDIQPFNNPLLFKMEGSDFLRIEGHVGKSFEEVFKELSDYRLKFNLPFQIVALKIAGKFEGELLFCGCENFECEKEKIRLKYIKVRQILTDALYPFLILEVLNNKIPSALVNSLQNTLKETLDIFDYSQFEIAYDTLEQSEYYTGLKERFLPEQGKESFQRIWKCFTELNNREEEIRNKHLFHHFAKVYPGMEHASGVPLGGTFIIVYVDHSEVQKEISALKEFIGNMQISPEEKRYRQLIAEKSRLVAGDFYLPYACLSCVPPICQVISRPVPIFIVSPSVFCGNDPKANELTVIVYPGGGLIQGPGYKFEEGKHLFTPANTGVDQGMVTLKYYVDGGEAAYNLTLVNPPNADFEIKDTQNEPITNICQDHGLLFLIPVTPEGEFTAWIGETELTGIIGTSENNQKTFDPAKLNFENANPLTVEIRYTVEHNFCKKTSQRIIKVSPVPDASFTFKGNVTEICKENGPLQLLPTIAGGNFTAHINNSGPINGAISKNENKNWFFNPEVINLGQGQSVQVIIRHYILSQYGCYKSVENPILVWSSSDSEFTTLPKRVCQNSNPIPLNPKVPGGIFTAETDPVETPDGLIVDNILYPGSIHSEKEVTVTITYTLVNGPCVRSTVKSTKIVPLPDASFSFEGEVTELCRENGRIQLNPVALGGKFTAYINHSGPIPNATFLDKGKWYFNPAVIKMDQGQRVQVTIHYQITSESGCKNESERTIIVWSSPDSEFSGLPDSVGQCNKAITLIPNVPGGIFTAVDSEKKPLDLFDGNIFYPNRIDSTDPVTVTIFYTLKNGVCESFTEKTISVRPVPVADFTAYFSIPSENKKFYFIKVVNIHPENATEYYWEITPSSIHAPIKFDNNRDFEIPVIVEQTIQVTVFLTLTVISEEGCKSHPVIKAVLPVINSLELDGINQNSEKMEILTQYSLYEGAVIPAIYLKSNWFNIRAYPLPPNVGKVNFILKEPVLKDSSSSGQFGGYYMADTNGLEVITGNYELEVTPVTVEGVKGLITVMKFSITDSEPEVSSDESVKMLRQRETGLVTELNEMATDITISETPDFKQVHSLMNFKGEPDALNVRFTETMDTLVKSIAKSRKGSLRQKKLQKLATLSVKFFMDRQVEINPAEPDTNTIEILQTFLNDLKSSGMDIQALEQEWNSDDLLKIFPAPSPVINAFSKLLK